MLGRVVMLEDHVKGGVTSKTYLNVTLRTYVDGSYLQWSVDCVVAYVNLQ